MSDKKTECPNCLGSGEEFYKGKYPRPCYICKGAGVVNIEVAQNYLDEHLFDSLE